MTLILFPSNLNPSSGQDVFHGGAIKLGEILIELAIREESLPEGVDCNLLVAKWDGDIFSIEASHVVAE